MQPSSAPTPHRTCVRRHQCTTRCRDTGQPACDVADARRRWKSCARSGRDAGDAELARRLEHIASKFAPDFDEAFAKVFGDVIGFQIARAVRGGLGWARASAQALTRDTVDYLQEESRDLVSRPELDGFLDDVDALRERGDRLLARAQRVLPMRKASAIAPGLARRLFGIAGVLMRYRLDDLVALKNLPLLLRGLCRILPRGGAQIAQLPRGERLVLALTELGPIFVKSRDSFHTP